MKISSIVLKLYSRHNVHAEITKGHNLVKMLGGGMALVLCTLSDTALYILSDTALYHVL